MTEREIKFDNFFKNRNGIFLFNSDLTNEVKSFITRIENYLKPRYPTLPNIIGDFIADNSLNAVAGKYEDDYFVGINIGTYFLIGDMFNKMMATKSVFEKIGNIAIETSDKKILNAIIENKSISFDHANTTNVIVAKDPIRRDFGGICTSLIMNFIIFHEFGHIIRGHVGYVNQFNYNTIEEIDSAIKPVEPLTYRTLEMDADSFAVNHMFLIGIQYLNVHNLSHPFNLLYKDIPTFLSNFIFSIYCLFKLFEIEEFNPAIANNLNHPPPSIRISLILDNVASLLEHHQIANQDDLIKQILYSVVEAENAFSSIRYFSNNSSSLFFSNHAKSEEYVNEILLNWKNVYPLIEPFAFGKLPPIVV